MTIGPSEGRVIHRSPRQAAVVRRGRRPPAGDGSADHGRGVPFLTVATMMIARLSLPKRGTDRLSARLSEARTDSHYAISPCAHA